MPGSASRSSESSPAWPPRIFSHSSREASARLIRSSIGMIWLVKSTMVIRPKR
ncbi:hypothetical protein SCALM49S_05292 [Streptomyces californicus]